MEVIDIIRMLCKKNGTTINQLEKKLGYGQGTLARSKVIGSDRIFEISKLFNVSMESIMTGKGIDDDELPPEDDPIVVDEIRKANERLAILQKITDTQERLLDLAIQTDQLNKTLVELKLQYKISMEGDE